MSGYGDYKGSLGYYRGVNTDDLANARPSSIIRLRAERIASQFNTNYGLSGYRPAPLRGNCNVCGGPLEKARNALCWYCKRPI